MILVDANLLIYAVDRDSPHHDKAHRWLEDTLSGTTETGLAWIVVLAFLRITTHPKIMCKPMAVETSLEYVSSWLSQPCVSLIRPGKQHWSVFRNLVNMVGTGGNLTSDAHLAALAIEHGSDLYSADYDFQRFPGIRHINPLAVS
jgi:toxin-antitoxin system PIN domain toxin